MCSIDSHASASSAGGCFPVFDGKQVIDVARSKGAFRLIAFTAVGNERLLKRMGVNTRRISAPQLIDNKSVVPFWIEIDDETTSALSLAA